MYDVGACHQAYFTPKIVQLLLAHDHQVGFVSINYNLIALHIIGDQLVPVGKSVGEYHWALASKAISCIIYTVDKAATGWAVHGRRCDGEEVEVSLFLSQTFQIRILMI